MKRLAYVLIIGVVLFLLVALSKKGDGFEDEPEYDKVPECESCALTSLEPKRVCPSGMCTQLGGRIGCRT